MGSVVAEHTLLLILAVYRRLLQLDAAVRSGAWRTSEPVLYELRGKRVGLVGLGYIGREVALRLRAFGAEVVYAARRPVAESSNHSSPRRPPMGGAIGKRSGPSPRPALDCSAGRRRCGRCRG